MVERSILNRMSYLARMEHSHSTKVIVTANKERGGQTRPKDCLTLFQKPCHPEGRPGKLVDGRILVRFQLGSVHEVSQKFARVGIEVLELIGLCSRKE
jgi:hypothetical protein